MITNLKALVVILALAWVVFYIARSVCLRFMSEEDFNHRRMVWLLLTGLAFLSPSFWFYAIVGFPIMFWAGRKDNNPVALYLLLLHVVPPYSFALPSAMFNQLFDLNNYRLLALSILLPAAWQLIHKKNQPTASSVALADKYLWAYLALQLVLLLPYENLTNTLRRGSLFLLDTTLLFYVISRYCDNHKRLIETIAVFALSCALLVPIACFESTRNWLLYVGIASVWDASTLTSYLMRGESLRAQVSTGHALVLGLYLALALVFWLFLASKFESKFKPILGCIGLWLGLIAAYSRAPWIAAILGFVAYHGLRTGGLKHLLKTAVWVLPLGGVLMVSPMGAEIVDSLPFIGTVDSGNVDYRQDLAESSWELIKLNPWFGDPFFMANLEHLRQGQGIIDLVNVYASIAMLFGCVGLAIFLGPWLIAMLQTYRVSKRAQATDSDISLLGTSLLACMLATSFFMVTGSFGTGLEKIYYILAALGVAYSGIEVMPQKTDQTATESAINLPSFWKSNNPSK